MSSFAASFAPYQPPPDETTRAPAAATAPATAVRATMSQASSLIRPWFPAHASSSASMSYQSGGVPTMNNALGGGGGAGGSGESYGSYASAGDVAAAAAAAEEGDASGGGSNPNAVWETRFGTRVDVMAACAYILGPISALLLLILETHNDYVRFHAYQSALLTTPLVVLRILASLIHLPGFLRTLLTLTIILSELFMAFRAYRDAAQNGLSRYQLPYIGPHAEQWVREE